MNHLNDLLKVIEIELRSGLKNFSKETIHDNLYLDSDYKLIPKHRK